MTGATVKEIGCLLQQLENHMFQVLLNIKLQVFVNKMLTSTAKDFTLFVSYLSFWDQMKWHILAVSRETVFCT